jgi:hypothetical protein
MPSQHGMPVSDIVTAARGMYERVARQLNVSVYGQPWWPVESASHEKSALLCAKN